MEVDKLQVAELLIFSSFYLYSFHLKNKLNTVSVSVEKLYSRQQVAVPLAIRAVPVSEIQSPAPLG